MKITLVKATVVNGGVFEAGAEMDVPEGVGKRMIRQGQAVKVEKARPKVEKAVRPGGEVRGSLATDEGNTDGDGLSTE